MNFIGQTSNVPCSEDDQTSFYRLLHYVCGKVKYNKKGLLRIITIVETLTQYTLKNINKVAWYPWIHSQAGANILSWAPNFRQKKLYSLLDIHPTYRADVSKVGYWSGICLSYRGRVEIFNWIIAGKCTYCAQENTLPSSVIKNRKLALVVCQFIWDARVYSLISNDPP